MKYGVNVFLITISLLGILVIIGALSVRHNQRFDLTETRRYILSPQSIKILQGLKEQVKVSAFYQNATRGGADDLLAQYAYHSRRFTYEVIDPDRYPLKAQRYGIANYGTVVVEYGKRQEKIFALTERALTNTIIRVTKKKKKIVYFLQGHGEHGLDDTERNGYSAIKKAVEDQSYVVKPLLLLRVQGVPHDAALVVIGGPQKDFLPIETRDIKQYVERGGKLLIMADPYTGPNLMKFLDGYGLHLGDDVIIDKLGRIFGGDYLIPVVSVYEDHPITENFGFSSFFPLVQSITIAQKPPKDIEVSSLAQTGTQSWAEVDREGLEKGEALFEEDQDNGGPLTVAAVATKRVETTGDKGERARIVLFGDSDFIANSFFSILGTGNGDFFLNALSWLVEDEDLIAIRPKPPKISPLMLRPSEARWIFWFAVVILPGSVAGAGVLILTRRR